MPEQTKQQQQQQQQQKAKGKNSSVYPTYSVGLICSVSLRNWLEKEKGGVQLFIAYVQRRVKEIGGWFVLLSIVLF